MNTEALLSPIAEIGKVMYAEGYRDISCLLKLAQLLFFKQVSTIHGTVQY